MFLLKSNKFEEIVYHPIKHDLMIRNRKTPPPLETLSDGEWKHAELVFRLYVLKKWYYVGGNHGPHLKCFTILCTNQPIPKREDSCYLCQTPMNPRRAYYIKKNTNEGEIQQIGRCCYGQYDVFYKRESVVYPLHRVKQKME